MKVFSLVTLVTHILSFVAFVTQIDLVTVVSTKLITSSDFTASVTFGVNAQLGVK